MLVAKEMVPSASVEDVFLLSQQLVVFIWFFRSSPVLKKTFLLSPTAFFYNIKDQIVGQELMRDELHNALFEEPGKRGSFFYPSLL